VSVGRRAWLYGTLVASVAAVVGVLAAGRSDERGALQVVRQVLQAAEVHPDELPGHRDRRLQEVLKSAFTDPVTLRHVDLPKTGAGHRGLLLWGRLLQSYRYVRFQVEQQQVELSDDGRAATVRLRVAMTGEKKGEEQHETRAVDVRLRRSSEGWKIELLDVAASERGQPEARP
jgi:hypothetical protein